jgi:hypothetical protein
MEWEMKKEGNERWRLTRRYKQVSSLRTAYKWIIFKIRRENEALQGRIVSLRQTEYQTRRKPPRLRISQIEDILRHEGLKELIYSETKDVPFRLY